MIKKIKPKNKASEDDAKAWIAIGVGIVYLLILFLTPMYTQAADYHAEILFDKDRRLEVLIGSEGINRIEIREGEVLEIVGDEAKYKLKSSSDSRSIFIEPKVAVGESIDISLIMMSSEVQDLRLVIGDAPGRTIVLSLEEHQKDIRSKLEAASSKEEIENLISAMKEESTREGKYWIQNVSKIVKHKAGMQVKYLKEYRYSDLAGVIFEIENKDKKEIKLLEEELKGLLTGAIAMSVDKVIILPKEKSRIFAVSNFKQGK